MCLVIASHFSAPSNILRSIATSPHAYVHINNSITNMRSKGGRKRVRRQRDLARSDPTTARRLQVNAINDGRVASLEAKCENLECENDLLKRENDLFKLQNRAQLTHVALADQEARDAKALKTTLCNKYIRVDGSEVITEEEFNKRLPEEMDELIADMDKIGLKLSAVNEKSGSSFSLATIVILTKAKAKAVPSSTG